MARRPVIRESQGRPLTAPPQPSGMVIEEWPLEKVIPYERNARRNDKAVDAVAESIRRYGWQQVIVVDKAGVIIAGHTRLKAAIKLGLRTVPVKVADLPPDKVRQYRLADNKTHDLAEWDDEILAAEIADMSTGDLTGVGFDEVELATLRGEAAEQKKSKAGGGGGDAAADSGLRYELVITAADEAAQKVLYERFTAEDLKCRIMTY